MKRNVADKPQEQEQQQVNVTVNPFKSDADSGWYLRYKGKPDGMVSIVSDKHPAWDSKTYLPSWAKVPPQPQPSWVRRSNTVHNVWQTPSAGDRGGFVAAPVNYLTDYQQQQTLLSDGDPQQPSMNEGDEMGKLVISTDNVILPNVAQSPDVAIIKAKNTGEKQLDPPVVITRNPFAAVEPIFSRDREGKSVHVHFSPGAKGQPSVQQGVQQPVEQQHQQNGIVEGALV